MLSMFKKKGKKGPEEGSPSSPMKLPRLLVLYGTQTGTAEGFAKQLAREALRHRFLPDVQNIEDYEFQDKLSNEDLVVCLFATQGDGEPTDDAEEFFMWLDEEVEGEDKELLSGMRYSVFALGSTAYEHYCVMGKKIDSAFEALGGTRMHEIGLGDDDKSIEDDFVLWSGAFLEKLSHLSGADGETLKKAAFAIKHCDKSTKTEAVHTPIQGNRAPTINKPFMARVTENIELCDDAEKDAGSKSVHRIEISLEGSGARYAPGDHIGVFPSNNEAQILRLMKLLGLANDDLGQVFDLEPQGELGKVMPPPFPVPTTYGAVLGHLMDITAPLGIYAIKTLAEFASNEEESMKLKTIVKDDYHKSVKEERMCLADFLEEYPSIKGSIPVISALELIPKLTPRYYSIASSQKKVGKSVRIVVTLVRFVTPKKKVAFGTCSSWLCSSKPGDIVPVFIRKSRFHLPRNPQQPIVMIGPGCGVAPFIGFMEELTELPVDSETKKRKIGENMMLFGCRNRNQDYLFANELQQWKEEGILSHLHVAFSREKEEKEYVQSLISRPEVGKEIADLLSTKRRGILYVCGDAGKMSVDVHNAIIDALSEHLEMSKEAAVKYVERLEKSGRYLKDTW